MCFLQALNHKYETLRYSTEQVSPGGNDLHVYSVYNFFSVLC